MCNVKMLRTFWIEYMTKPASVPVPVLDLTEKVVVHRFLNWFKPLPKTGLVYNYQTDINVLGLQP